MAQGKGVRCTGFWSADQELIFCSREEQAGECPVAGDAADTVYRHVANGPCKCGMTHGHETTRSTGGYMSLDSAMAVYDYHDEKGELRYKIARFLPKTFRPYHLADGVWKTGLNGEKRVLYRMPEVMAYDPAKVILLVEGEKDVNTAWDVGLPATCNSGGAKSWNGDIVPLARRILKGRKLLVVADNDANGEGDHWAKTICDSMIGFAASVHIVHMPAPHKDLTDAVQAGLDIKAILRAAAVEESEAAEEALRNRKTRITTAQIFAPIPPTKWTVEGLQICPGRPTMLLGFGYSGKSLFVQSIALHVAAGRRAFDRWDVTKGKVLHIDFDQGLKATKKRYQRLARGHGITLEELEDRLEIESHPPDLRLLAPGAADMLEKVVAGHSLIITDALKGLTSGIDENESSIRDHLDLLTPISERTGASFLILHHEGKGDPEDGRMAGRGSSSIYDASGSVFRLQGDKTDKTGPKRLIQLKSSAEAEGPACDDLMVTISDVEDVRGVRVDLSDAEQAGDGDSAADIAGGVLERRVVASVKANPLKLQSLNAIQKVTKGRRALVIESATALEAAGRIRRDAHGFYEVTW